MSQPVTLAEHQSRMSRLLGEDRSDICEDDEYVTRVVKSDGFRVMCWSIRQWRRYNLLRACPLTTTALALETRLEVALDDFLLSRSIPVLLDDLAQTFLEYVATDANPVVSAVARYEQILLLRRVDPTGEWFIDWPCDPQDALGAILAKKQLPTTRQNLVRTRVRAAEPGVLEPV